jgi:hypothetical protein
MKIYGGVVVWLHVFFTSALDRGEWSALCPSHFSPEERAPGTHEGMGGPQRNSGRCGEEKNLALPGIEEARGSVVG